MHIFFKNLFSAFVSLLIVVFHVIGQEKTEKFPVLFIEEGLQYYWNFEFPEKALLNGVNNGEQNRLNIEGKVEFENGLAKFYNKANDGSSLQTSVNHVFQEGLTLWMRFLLPEVENKTGNDSIKLTFLEFEPFQLFLSTSQKYRYKYGIGLQLKQKNTDYGLEPSLQHNLAEGSWIQVALLFDNEQDCGKAKLFYRLERPNQDANNWSYVGRIVVQEKIQLSNTLIFGGLKSDYGKIGYLYVDELRLYDSTFGLEKLGDLWPVYQNFDPAKDQPPGVVIDYSSAKTRRFIAGSPSIVILDDGAYIAKGDDYGPGVGISELARVYKSTDKGATWTQIAEVEGITWASLFVHNKDIYMLGTNAGHTLGHVVIIKSVDGGYTWTKAVDPRNGKLTSDLSYHTAPVPVVFHNGRIWRTMEDEKGPGGWGTNFRAFLMSASLKDDLLKASSWTFSNTLAYDSSRLEGNFKGWLEGNTVLGPNGNIVNLLRVATKTGGGRAALINYNKDGSIGTFNETNGFIDFPGGSTKFHILYDKKTKMYWALSNAVPEKHKGRAYTEGMTRNTLVLMTSGDLVNWSIRKTLLYHPDVAKHSFQYPTFLIDGEDIVFVARTAYDDGRGGAYKQHDANFFTFHRVENFRKLLRK